LQTANYGLIETKHALSLPNPRRFLQFTVNLPLFLRFKNKRNGMGTNHIRIGASGWHYKHWIGEFYPENIRPGEMLSYYLQHFDTVEINNSFYRLPEKKTFENWAKSTPDEFIFAVKASRYITHIKKLREGREAVAKLEERTDALGKKLGPVLFQLPPGWNFNGQRFHEFTDSLPKGFQYAFEFRNHSWYNEEVYSALSSHNAAFVVYELEGHTSPLRLTADFAYLRLHGPAGKYQGSYSDDALKSWIDRFRNWQNHGIKEVYCYFDNDQKGYAALNAKRMKTLL